MQTYPLFKVHVQQREAVRYITKVFKSGFINEGVQVTELTNELQKLLAARNLILLNSCTSAITLSLHLAGVGVGDEVITTPMTCVASNTPIVTRGANIVWADVDPNNGMLDPKDVAKRITAKTKAVIAVAWGGTPPDLFELQRVCKTNNVKLILDLAHAFDAQYKNFPAHLWADYTCYSFQAIKHFTTGDGGALVCASDDDYRRSKSLKWFGLDRDIAKDEKGNWKGQQWDVDIVEAGYKFNMNNVSAAIGLSQLPHIKNIMLRHRLNAQRYDDLFNDFEYAQHCSRPDAHGSSFWVYTMKLSPSCSISRDELLRLLNSEGIMAGVVHVPNDSYTAFQKFESDLPGVRDFSTHQFSLPCGWWLTSEDVQHIAARVKELLK